MGYLTEQQYADYLSLYESLSQSLTKPKCLVLLDCSTEEVLARIWRRGRTDEIHLEVEYSVSRRETNGTAPSSNELDFGTVIVRLLPHYFHSRR